MQVYSATYATARHTLATATRKQNATQAVFATVQTRRSENQQMTLNYLHS